ncbi:hypothetical protein TNCV_4076851 [Trichonephila clavipes]|nr:hypothetical protein TNCV_4076851 [Trichonephila clavipes]
MPPLPYEFDKSVGLTVLWVVAAETTGSGCWRIFSSLPAHAKFVEVEIGGIAIYRLEVQPISGSGNLLPFSSERTQQQHYVFGLVIHQNDHQARRRFVEWAQNEMAVVPDFHKRILFSDEAHFWLNGYVNKQNCRIWSEANPQVYVETPLHPEKLTVMGWWNHWSGLLQKR